MTQFRISRARLLPGLSLGNTGVADLTITDGRITKISPSQNQPDGDFDAEHAWVLPGLWDHHVHFSLAALMADCLQLGDDWPKSRVLAEVAKQSPATEPLVGYGFRSATWGSSPTRQELDAVCPKPVALISRDLHSVWCNTAALGVIGQPEHRTGFLVEAEAFAAIRRLMVGEPELVEAAVARFEQVVASRGLVGIIDFSSSWAVETWQQRAAQRQLGLKVEAATYPERLDDLLALGAPTGTKLAANLRLGPLKVIADGSMGSRTAYCSLPYPTALPEYPYGKPNYSLAELTELLGRAARGGIKAAVHAIGDAAASLALTAFERSQARGTVEHAQCLGPAEISRLAALGLSASIQPAHQVADRSVVEQVWPGLVHHAYPMRDLLQAGIPLALGSDAPVAPLDPWLAIAAATSSPYRHSQRLTRLEALRASTRSLVAIGQPADLVLVNDDDAVMLTLLGGQVTYQG